MTVEIVFDDNDHIYRVDFLKLASKLGINESDITKAIAAEIRKS